jgi:hypothetical protein
MCATRSPGGFFGALRSLVARAEGPASSATVARRWQLQNATTSAVSQAGTKARTRPEDTRVDGAVFAYWHLPETHPCPAAQVVPHVPQFAASVERSEHVPAQFVVPVGHAQAPFVQTRLLPQIWEQSPQLSLLFCRSTQTGGVPHDV